MPQESITEEDEAFRVLQWRFDFLRAAKIKEGSARKLSVTDADLHRIVKAKHAGCTDKMLEDIFT